MNDKCRVEEWCEDTGDRLTLIIKDRFEVLINLLSKKKNRTFSPLTKNFSTPLTSPSVDQIFLHQLLVELTLEIFSCIFSVINE